MYFYLCGLFSAFLDNTPTFLMFFNVAGGDAEQLMNELSTTLLAISMGAVFMGAMTYIGNAPNFIVKSICEEQGVKMPSFGGYVVWTALLLLPVLVLAANVFLDPI